MPSLPSISSGYLDDIQSNIRSRPIPWEGYERANVITSAEANLVRTIEKSSTIDKRLATIQENPLQYAQTIIGSLSRISRDDLLKYILSLAGDLARDSSDFRSALLSQSETYSTLSGLLDRPNEQIHLLASRALFYLITSSLHDADSAPGNGVAPNEVVTSFVTYVAKKLLPSQNPAVQEVAVQYYNGILETKQYRSLFWSVVSSDQCADAVPTLVKLLESSRGQLQLQYYTLLMFWLLTFEPTPARQLIADYGLVPVLLAIIRTSVKQKIVRVALAILINSVGLAASVSIPSLISHSALPLIKTLADRQWNDDELKDSLTFLRDKLQESFDSMSTFDEYNSEIIGKKLRWSPPHRSDVFWKQNIAKFKESDYRILKPLAAILTSSSTDTISLAVGCNDVNHIVNELPESIHVFEKLGTKVRVMQLMNHQDPEVRYEALRATQAFMAHSLNK